VEDVAVARFVIDGGATLEFARTVLVSPDASVQKRVRDLVPTAPVKALA
jgi:hypothetical protein